MPPPATASPPGETPALPTDHACAVETPETYSQVRSGPHHVLRDGAMGKEMDGYRVEGTLEKEEGKWQRGANVVSSTWV